MYKCKFCDKEYEKIQQLGGHIVYCQENPGKREKKTSKKIFSLKCKTCGEDYEILETQHNIDNNKYKKNCSIKCANKRNHTEEIKESISKKLIKVNNLDRKRNCPLCKKEFLYKKKKQIFCSKKCNSINNNNNGAALKGGLASKISIKTYSNRSKNEIAFANKCLEYFTNVSLNEKFFNGWDSDIILHNEKIAILWNGIWHYKKVYENHYLEQVQNRDRLKTIEIKNKGYIPYIIKDVGSYSIKKVNLEWDLFLEWINKIN